MNTVKIEKKNCKMIAHRGCSGLETENTCAAFVVAGVKSYYGVETDVWVTGDGKYILCHDGTTGRVSSVDLEISKSSYDELRTIVLNDYEGNPRNDLRLAALEEYISVCRRYDKTCVLELKGFITEEHVKNIVERIKAADWLHRTVFIGFDKGSMLNLRKVYPEARAQFLCGELTEENFSFIKENRFDLDVHHGKLTKEQVDKVHEEGLEVNVWTVDDVDRAATLIEMGVDYITTNILE